MKGRGTTFLLIALVCLAETAFAFDAATSLTISSSSTEFTGTANATGSREVNYGGVKKLRFTGASASTTTVKDPAIIDRDGRTRDLGSPTPVGSENRSAEVKGENAATKNRAVTLPREGGAAPSGMTAVAAHEPFGKSLTELDASKDNVTLTNNPGGMISVLGDPGHRTLLASASAGKSGISENYLTPAGNPAQLVFLEQPTNTRINTVITPAVTVQVQDSSGAVVAQSGIIVTLAISSGTGILAGTLQQATDVNGVATFADLTINQTGPKQLTAASSGLASATSQSFSIIAGPATKLVVQTQPSTSATAGVALGQQPVLAIEDSGGNIVEADNSTTVTAGITGLTLQGTSTVTAVNGIVTFTDLALTKAGSFQLQFTSQPALVGATSTAIAVAPGAATKLAFTQQPTNVPLSAVITPAVAVQVRDAFDNDVASAAVAVTMALSSGTGTLAGTLAQNTSAGGTAAFPDLSINTTGLKTLTASSAGLTPAVSAGFTVGAGPASRLVMQTQPSATGTAGTPFNPQPAVAIADASGNIVTTDNSTVVTVQESPGGPGGLTGTLTATAVNGIASFTNLAETKAGTVSMQFTSQPALTPVASNSIVVGAATASKLAYTQQPSSGTVGAPITPPVTVQLIDAFNNNVAQAGVPVTMSLNSGTGTLGGTTTRDSNGSGLASFNDLSINAPGQKVLLASSSTLASALSTSFQVSPGAATQMAYTQQPSSVVAGTVITPAISVQLLDGGGNAVTASGVPVTVSLNGTGTLSGTLTQTTVNGIATFNDLSIQTSGQKTLTMSSAGLTSAASQAFTVSPAAAAATAFAQQPTSVTADAVISPPVTVQLRDAYGNSVPTAGVPVTVTLSSGTGPLVGTLVQNTDATGLATFNDLNISTTGDKILTATANGLTAGVSATFTITPGAATDLAFVQQPTNAAVNAAITPPVTVQLKDSHDNNPTSDGVPITLTLNGTGTLNGTVTRNTVGGLATFNDLSVTQAGQKTLTASSSGLKSKNSAQFTISAGPATALVIQTQPSPAAVAGVAFSQQPVIAIVDAGGNIVVTDNTTTVTATGTSGATLQGTVTVKAVNGIATFTNLAFNQSGTYQIQFTSQPALTGALSNAVAVTPAAASKLVFVQQPTNAAAGVVIAPPVTVQLHDAFDNVVTTAGVTVTMALSSGTGTLGGTASHNTDATGTATFSDLTISQGGQKTLTAASAGLTSATSQAFTISAGAASKLVIQRQPSGTATAGVAFARQPIVTITDASGDIITSDNTTVVTAAESAGGPGGLQGTTSVTAVNGVATFKDLAETKAGTVSLTFTSQPVLTAATSSNITVSAAPASKLAFIQGPTNTAAGATITPPVTVQLRDVFDNDVARSGVAVTMTLSSGTGVLSGSTVRNTNSAGLATFGTLKISISGDKVLTASSGNLTPAVSSTFTIGAGAATALFIQTQPSPTAVAGVPFTQQPVIAIVDAGGTVVTTDNTTTVTAQETNNSATLQGTVTVKAVNGIIAFTNLAFNLSGTFKLQFSSQPALAGAISNDIVVSPAAAAKLVFVQQPTNATAGVAIAPPVSVQLHDAFDNVVTAAGVAVTMALSTGTGTLSGTTTQSTVNGIATFGDLMIDQAGQKALTASSAGLASATSQTFTVGAGSANQLAYVQQPGNTAAGAVLSPAVSVKIIDAKGNTNPVNGTPITIFVASGDSIFGTTTKTTVNGIATFDNLQLRRAGQKALVASSPGLPATTSAQFTVAPGAAAKVAVETAADGNGTLLGSQSVASGNTIAGYAVTRDAFGNFIGNAKADSWLLQNITGGVTANDLTPATDKKSARFTGRAAGSAVILASVSGLTSVASGVVTVTAGSNFAKVLVETAADGSGTVLGDRQLTAGGNLIVYAIARDSSNNFVRNVVADQWSIVNATGGVVQQDLTPSPDKKSATFSAHLAGQTKIQASAGGFVGVPSGLITVVASTASKLEVAGGSSQEAQVNTEFPQRLRAKVTDTYGNPVGGVTVTFTAPANGPGGTFGGGNNTAISDAAGVATAAAFTANSFSGIFTVTASAPGISTSVTFTLTNKSGVGANIAVVEGTSQSTAVGTSFTTRFKVTVKDDAGNAIGGALVHFSAPASGPSGNFSGGLVDSARTTAAGEATSSAFTANFVAGSYSIIASTESGKTVSINLTNLPGPLTRFAIESDKGGKIDTQFVGVKFNIRIRALDAYDNAVTSFSEGTVITSTGDLFVGAGSTPPFVSGVLSSYTVGFQKTGSFTLVATRSGGGASGTSNAFFVGNPRPLVRGVSPSNGLAGQTVVVSLTGRGFLAGVTSVSFGDGIGTSTTINSDTVMSITLQIGTNVTPGPRDVTVINAPPIGGVAFLANGFTIGDHPRPTISSIVPSSVAQLQSARLFIRGTNFLGNGFTHLFFTGDGITVDSASVDSSSVIQADITVGASASLGSRDVVIVNDGPGGGTDTLYRALTVTPGVLAAPALLQPPNGAQSQPSTLSLSWESSPGATSYQIQLARDAAFATVVAFDSTTTTSYQVGPLPNPSVYYWRVRATGGGGISGWSSAWSFDNLPPVPTTISLNNVVDFPDHTNPSDYTSYDYRIVGLPGASNSRVNNFIPGIQDVDWRVFWDNGGAQGYLVSFDASSTFTFAPGRAFWLLKKGPWAVSVTIAAASIDSATRSVLVPIHTGWNLITNPMTWTIPWTEVQAANGIQGPIYGFEGLYNQSDNFAPYVGYYFFDDPSSPLGVLKVPYGPGLGKNVVHKTPPDSSDSWTVHVDLRSGKYVDRITILGASTAAGPGKNKLDFRRPRSFGDMPSVYFPRPEWDSVYSTFASDIRPPFSDKDSWTFVVASKGPKGGELELDFRGLEAVPAGMEVYLVDEAGSSYHDLRKEGAAYRFVPASPTTAFKMLIGKKEALANDLAGIMPRTFALDQNYPNPFNPSTAIPVSLPVRANVELKVYNILGQEVKTLHSGSLEAGRHVFMWDGTNLFGNSVATGVYIARFTTDTGVKLGRKMLLLK